MKSENEDPEATFAFASVALDQIRALNQPANPRNYEVWYHYASGHHPTVNQLINEIIETSGKLSQTDVDGIYDKYFSPVRQADKVDNATAKFMEQIEKVMSMIDSASGTATQHSQNLADMSDRIGAATDSTSLRVIVESLAQTARSMEESNKILEGKLKNSKQEITQLHAHLEAVRMESLTDPLTTLANRKCFDGALANAITDANGAGEHLSLLLCDIDHFKTFNDTFGHLIGDQVLRLVALSLKDNVKGRDLAARYGGEEFAVLLPDTSLRQATTVAEQIRRAVMGRELMKRSTGENLGRITMSIGVASLHRGESPPSLLERTDNCLYAAKRNGRNRVICEIDPEVAPLTNANVA
ncbi:MAG TPA: GGDEF domain-containing protein [Xanthobacteraceae bacterium]|nr:GGDEF domain-containing protein [Xanthobacteraceae bacterium]